MPHLSFDFWNTIGKPNLTFSAERNRVLAGLFGTTVEEAGRTYTAAKTRLIAEGECSGLDHGQDHGIKMLCEMFGQPDTTDDIRATIASEMERLFSLHPPTIETSLVNLLYKAHLSGITLSIGSNTDIIMGQSIVDHVVGRLPFDFAVFSDEVGVYKPNPEFFTLILDGARRVNNRVTDYGDIIHIGDSMVCDIGGAVGVGMRHAHVIDADNTSQVLSNLLVNMLEVV